MRAGIYARISDDREETQAGVGRQVKDCEALAEKRGWPVSESYVDNDLSAYKAVRRPEWERLLHDIADKQLDAVIVYHLDRLIRQPRDLERFFDVCDAAGVKDMATVSGDIDLSTDDGRFNARIQGAVARKSSDDMSRRLKRKALELAQDGKVGGGGTRPYGFEQDRVTVREDEAVIIRELVGRFLAGETVRGLCADMNERGDFTTTGAEWSARSMSRMLASARISGQRQHQGEIIGDAVWAAIITPHERERVAAIFSDPSRRATRASQRYLLKGILRCWRCENPLVARPLADGRRRYVCAKGVGYVGCGGSYALGETIEAFVTELVLTRLDGLEIRKALQRRPTLTVVPDRAAHLETKLDELADAYAADVISMREWLKARDPLQQELDAERRRIARDNGMTLIAEIVGRGAELRKDWQSISFDRKRAIIIAVVLHVKVSPGRRGYNRFEPDRFEPFWRH